MRISITAPQEEFASVLNGRKFWEPEETKTFDNYPDAIRWIFCFSKTENQRLESWEFEKAVAVCDWAQTLQEYYAAHHMDSSATQEEIDAVLNVHRVETPWAGREWTHECPLVCVRDYYEDNALELPTGNVQMLCISDDREVIRLLGKTGIVTVEESELDV